MGEELACGCNIRAKMQMMTLFTALLVGSLKAHEFVETFHSDFYTFDAVAEENSTGYAQNCAPSESIGSFFNMSWTPKNLRTIDILTVRVDIEYSKIQALIAFYYRCEKENPELGIELALKFADGEAVVNVTDTMPCTSLLKLLVNGAIDRGDDAFLETKQYHGEFVDMLFSSGKCTNLVLDEDKREQIGNKYVMRCSRIFPDIMFLRYYTGNYTIVVDVTEKSSKTVLFCGSVTVDVSDQ